MDSAHEIYKNPDVLSGYRHFNPEIDRHLTISIRIKLKPSKKSGSEPYPLAAFGGIRWLDNYRPVGIRSIQFF